MLFGLTETLGAAGQAVVYKIDSLMDAQEKLRDTEVKEQNPLPGVAAEYPGVLWILCHVCHARG